MKGAVRVRNALLLRRGRLEDCNWTPASVPADFRVENAAAPPAIAEAVREAGAVCGDDDWRSMCALVTMLVSHSLREDAIRADLATTYREIVAGSGYCADYVRVYMAAARAVGLFSRQWAFSLDGFGGHGHTFVEVYDRQRGQWVFLDVHNNVYAVISGSETPLDALSLRGALRAGPEISFRRVGPGRLGWEHFDKLTAYYRRGMDQWYLWWGNDVITRDLVGPVAALAKISGYLAHRLASAFGGLPPFVVIVTPTNEPLVARMERLRARLAMVALLVAALAVLLAAWLGYRFWEGAHA